MFRWNEPVYVVYKLLSVPPTPAPTISLQPSLVPVKLPAISPTPSPTPPNTTNSPTAIPTPKLSHFPKSARVLEVPSSPGQSEVTTNLDRKLLSVHGANNDDHGNSNNDDTHSVIDDDHSVIDCGNTEWMWYVEGGDSTFQYRQFSAPANPSAYKTAVQERVKLPSQYENTSYSTVVQPAVLLLPVHTDGPSNYAQTSAFALTIGHSYGDSFKFVDVVVTKVYDDWGNSDYDYSFGASANLCLGLALFNVSVYNECPHPCQHGECVNGKCVCSEGWATDAVNETCSVCAFGYVGDACKECPGWVAYPGDSPLAGELFATCSGFGNCTSNATGTGPPTCQCEAGYVDEECSRCALGYHHVDLSNYSTGQTFACLVSASMIGVETPGALSRIFVST